MTVDSILAEACRRLDLPHCGRILAARPMPEALPWASIAPTTPPGQHPAVTALALAPTGALTPAMRGLFIEIVAGRPAESAALSYDLRTRYLLAPDELERLRAIATTFPLVQPRWPSRVVSLDDDALWSALAQSEATTDELKERAGRLDVSALAALFARDAIGDSLGKESREQWHTWIVALALCGFATWASLVAGLLAREAGDTRALARWCELAGEDLLAHPEHAFAEHRVSTFGKARDTIGGINLRLTQHTLRTRQTRSPADLGALDDLLNVGFTGELDPEVWMFALAGATEVQARLGRELPHATELYEFGTAREWWRYGRWAFLFCAISHREVNAEEVMAELDPFLRAFGGSTAAYVELRRFAKGKDLGERLDQRLLGDLVEHPDVAELWASLATGAREEIAARIRAQLGA